ncbi:MAG: Biotin-lipoyl like, partial [Chloroflexota bacterium]
MRKTFLIGVTALAIAGGGFFAVTSMNKPAAASDTVPVPTAVLAGNAVVAEARVIPARSAALSLVQGGVVAEVLVKDGETAKAGALLARLDNAEQQARLARAEAQLKNAEAQ